MSILISHLPLNTEPTSVWKSATFNAELVEKIVEKAQNLMEVGVEVWERKGNIIITERGFYVAHFEHRTLNYL